MTLSPRRSYSKATRAQIFLAADGRCYLCTRKIAPGEPWEVEHPKARALGGSDDPSECRPAHIDCHQGKTRKDRRIIRDADRAAVRHCGLKPKSKWQRGLRKKMNGDVER